MDEIRLYRKDKKGEPKQARPAAIVDPETSKSLLSAAGGTALSGLHTIGSVLNFPSRLLWGSVNALGGGEGGFGNLNPLDSTGGVELSHVLGNAGIIGKNDPSKWEWGDLGRGIVDLAGDPTTYLGIGGVTKAGLQATKQGALVGSKLGQIAKGERAIANVVNPLTRAPLASFGRGPNVAAGLDAIGRKTKIDRLIKAASDSAPVTYLKEKFHASAMGRTTPATQRAAESAYHEGTHRLNQAELESVNAVRNMQNVGPTNPVLERHRVEMNRPSPQLAPLKAAADVAHAEFQSLGGKIGDLKNTVKEHTRIGPKRALESRFYDKNGNLTHIRDNTKGDYTLAKDPNVAAFNEFHPNTPVQHMHRQIAEGIDYGGNSGYRASQKAMSAHSAIDQGRNIELHGNASTDMINRAYAEAGKHLATLPAGMSANKQAQSLAKHIQKMFKAEDAKAGTNLTGYFMTDVNGAKLAHSRARELANFIVANPQLAKTGPFTNHPIADLHSYLSSHAEKIPKAKAALQFMGKNAFIGRKGGRVFAEPLEEVSKYGLNLAAVNNSNSPMVRHALGQLGLNEDKAHLHVLAHLPASVRKDVMAEATAEATRLAKAKMSRFVAQHGPNPAAQQALEKQLLPKTLSESVLNLHLPAKEYSSLTGFLDKPGALSQGKIADYTKVLKANLLAMPATHSRNALSAMVTKFLQNTGGLASQKHAIALHLGGDVTGYAHLPEVASLMKSQGINESEALRRLAATHLKASSSLHGDLPVGQIGSQLSDLAENVPGPVSTTLTKALTAPLKAAVGYKDGKHVGWDAAKFWKIANAFGNKETKYGPAMASELAAKGIEQPIRLAGFLDAMKQGHSAAEAAKLVGRGQVNYGSREYSQFEKALKQFVPFYSFATRQGKHVLRELASDQGGRMAQLVKAQDRANSGDQSIPDYILSGTSLPIGQGDDGTKHYVTGFGLAHEPAIHTLGALARLDFRNAGQDLLAQTHPAIRMPLEHFTGQSFFQRGEPLSNLDPNVGRTLSNIGVGLGLRDENAGPVKYPGSSAVEAALSVSPISRLAATARQATDTRKTVLEKAGNLLSGIKTTAVSPKKQQYTLLKRAQDLAKEHGAKSRQDIYFNKSELEALKQSDPALYQKQVELQQLLNSLKAKSPKKAKKEKGKLLRLEPAK